jgi:lactate permease
VDWTQNYNPTGSEAVSTLLAAAPVVVLLGTLGLLRWSAPRAAAAGLAAALAVAIWAFGMPAPMALAAAGFGACFGLLPIGWIVVTAVFLYTLTVEAGQFDKIKSSIATLSPDRRIQALLIAFNFGAFMEGCAGFGAPVAISSALLIGIGFPPLYAAGLSLLANTAPVAFGSLGIPIITLGQVTGISPDVISIMAGRQLPIFSLLIPAWMVVTMSGWRGLREVWPATLVAGGSFAVVQFTVSQLFGPMLVDVAGGLISLAAMTLFLRIWKPRNVWRFAHEPAHAPDFIAEDTPNRVGLSAAAETSHTPHYSRGETARAWVPWLLLSLCVFLWGVPQVRTLLEGGLTSKAIAEREKKAAAENRPVAPLTWWEQPSALAGRTVVRFEIPPLHNRVFRSPPVVQPPKDSTERVKPEEAVYELKWLTATGTSVLLAAILSAIWLRIPPVRFVKTFGRTLRMMAGPLFTIAAMVALAYVTRYSGTDATLGLAFTHTGALYPFFAPLLGWLGVALTGSDTSSNLLFGNLQKITAGQLGLNQVLIVTSNSTGGVMGKMIDAQSIVVSASTTGQAGDESRILRFVFWHSLALACLMGLLVVLQAYVFTGMVP